MEEGEDSTRRQGSQVFAAHSETDSSPMSVGPPAPADRPVDDEDGRQGGFTTAELLANAALAVIALVAIWAALQKLGIHVVDWIQQQLGM
jgi:hypothetical protein